MRKLYKNLIAGITAVSLAAPTTQGCGDSPLDIEGIVISDQYYNPLNKVDYPSYIIVLDEKGKEVTIEETDPEKRKGKNDEPLLHKIDQLIKPGTKIRISNGLTINHELQRGNIEGLGTLVTVEILFYSDLRFREVPDP